MNDEIPRMDLATLTLAQCLEMVGEDFSLTLENREEVHLELISANRTTRDPTALPDGDRPFSLLFRGSANPVISQGMVNLIHPEYSFWGIFLVPIGVEEDGTLYEAVFS